MRCGASFRVCQWTPVRSCEVQGMSAGCRLNIHPSSMEVGPTPTSQACTLAQRPSLKRECWSSIRNIHPLGVDVGATSILRHGRTPQACGVRRARATLDCANFPVTYVCDMLTKIGLGHDCLTSNDDGVQVVMARTATFLISRGCCHVYVCDILAKI